MKSISLSLQTDTVSETALTPHRILRIYKSPCIAANGFDSTLAELSSAVRRANAKTHMRASVCLRNKLQNKSCCANAMHVRFALPLEAAHVARVLSSTAQCHCEFSLYTIHFFEHNCLLIYLRLKFPGMHFFSPPICQCCVCFKVFTCMCITPFALFLFFLFRLHSFSLSP